MYDHACLSTKCTLIKTGFKNLRSGTEAKFRPFVDALVPTKESYTILLLYHSDHHLTSETLRCDYYWPTMRAKVTDFIRACHPWQQSKTVQTGVGKYPAIDDHPSGCCGPSAGILEECLTLQNCLHHLGYNNTQGSNRKIIISIPFFWFGSQPRLINYVYNDQPLGKTVRGI